MSLYYIYKRRGCDSNPCTGVLCMVYKIYAGNQYQFYVAGTVD